MDCTDQIRLHPNLSHIRNFEMRSSHGKYSHCSLLGCDSPKCGKQVANFWSNLQPKDFYTGDEGCSFLQNGSTYLPTYMASYSTRSTIFFLLLFPFFSDGTVLWCLVLSTLWGNYCLIFKLK
jgi:hypothetical protein